MEQDFEKRLRATGITRSAYAVLSAIHHDNKSTPARLADFLGVDGATVTRTLDGIEKRGLIKRTPSARDRRSVDISLTGAGVQAVKQGLSDSKATNRKFTEGLTAAEVEKLQSDIQTMLANANDAVPNL
jgi:DNA-binding MarR family transcriptional regulator